MKILMLAWEYPPRVVGGLGRHVCDLSEALVNKGIDVIVVTRGFEAENDYEVINGVKIYRTTPQEIDNEDFSASIFKLNEKMLEVARRIIDEKGKGLIVHAHDWLVGAAAIRLKEVYNLPLITTIHATEYGRNHGIHTELQKNIHSEEWRLTYESCRVICCSQYMFKEVTTLFNVPWDKVDVYPNGIDPKKIEAQVNREEFSCRFAHPSEKIVLFVGRLFYEKGVHVLLNAIPTILATFNNVKFVIAGKGPVMDDLKHQAALLGITNRVYFTGYLDDDTLKGLYKCADIAVFPSLYEPFGIVALEGMAAGVPVVVSNVGGLSEVIEHGITGMKAYPNNPESLANNILALLCNPYLAEKIKENALEKVTTFYTWDYIAERTIKSYKRLWDKYMEAV